MLVGIEASAAVSSKRTGVGNYVVHVIAGLQNRAELDGARFIYFCNCKPEDSIDSAVGLRAENLYPYDRLASRMLWMQLGLPRSLARARPDLCHFPNHVGPLLRYSETPFVVTIHDMAVYRFPQHQPWKTVALHRAIIPILARQARLVLTVSESAREDILHYLKLPPERVRVVYEGVGPQFHPGAPEHLQRAQEVKSRYGLNFPYILSVGTIEPRKNHARLIEAFTSLVKQARIPHHLVIVGNHGWKVERLEEHLSQGTMAGRIHFLGYVPAPDLPLLYQGASVFAFPSLYEGFGLPLLEALASGVPTLISNAQALREVAGDHTTVVVDPTSVSSIAEGLHALISDDRLSARLQSNGLARAAGFTWDKCASETLALYREAVDRQRRFHPAGAVPGRPR